MRVDRRDFLKSLGIVGGALVVGCNTSAPEEKLHAYLSAPKAVVPGVAATYATVCRACPAGCGLWVKTREGKPIKLEGNPDHPLNQGKLCARGQAFVQSLYSPRRVQTPMVRVAGELRPASWNQALERAAEILGETRCAVVSGLEQGGYARLLQDAAAHLGGPHLCFEPLAPRPLAAACRLLFDRDEVPVFSLAQADQVLSLGADFLDTWLSPLQHAREWAEGHQAEQRALFVTYLGPRRHLTANMADDFHPLAADQCGPVLAALLRAVVARQKPTLTAALQEALTQILDKAPAPPRGLSDARLEQITDRLLSARAPLVMWGGPEVYGRDATTVATMVLLLNHLLGAFDKTVFLGRGHAWSKAAAHATVYSALHQAAHEPQQAVLLLGTDPLFSLPGGAALGAALQKAGRCIALAWEHNHSTAVAEVVLPAHHPLESWGDYEVERGLVGLLQPVRVPLYDSRHPGDILLDLTTRLGHPRRLPSSKDYVIEAWQHRCNDLAPNAWEDALSAGLCHVPAPTSTIVPLKPNRLHLLPPLYAASGQGVDLLVAATTLLYDGRGAGAEWLMETPDSLTQCAWEIPAELSQDLALTLNVSDGDVVTLTSPHAEVQGRVLVARGACPNTLALRLGGEHPALPEEVLAPNPMRLIGPVFDPLSGALVWVQGRIGMARSAKSTLASVMGSPHSEGRNLCLSMSASDFAKGRFPRMDMHGEVLPDAAGNYPDKRYAQMPVEEIALEGQRPANNMTPLTEHPEQRWGMVVDLDRCIGCAACVTACYAENNIPVVGRAEVLRGRELSWMRIEQHITADVRQGQVRFLPIMCQQCGQAPCETVCPVFAAYHTPDGLNAQVYNRCVGTRYCSNNCPYKVRRFNWFDYPRPEPGNQQLNPDVTVRPRGVMEKCTFCVHRIREARNRAAFEGRPLRDGEIQPACVQTCPTGALRFGNFKDLDAEATQWSQNPRGYRVLDYLLNTRPGVVYLRKVYADSQEGQG